MKHLLKLVNENELLKKNVKEVQDQLRKAYKRIKELTDELYHYKKKKKKNLTEE
tara:strand:+ start:2001 stop:2162 length:162 start_codon:yes stop_codon:yes gene_type:complete